ncbi:MAG TPA: SigE family RNA polymerase sigma factor [Acidimicrobiales bacterium]|nr:SigE family RNA polymerase sigma factor [Acidimicrobiales bacterium]
MDSSGGFDAFFFAELPVVLRLAQRMTGNATAAEDIAAEAFARAFARWDRVGRLDYRQAWVLKVASNLAIDLARRRRPVLPSRPAAPDPAGEVAVRLTMVQALRSLPRGQREALVLRYLADLPEAEVAAALGVKQGTVKSHLHRAREAMRSRLGADLEEFGYGTTSP